MIKTAILACAVSLLTAVATSRVFDSSASRRSDGHLEVRDSQGRVRLRTLELPNGDFALLLQSPSGAAQLRMESREEAAEVLIVDASGQPRIRMGANGPGAAANQEWSVDVASDYGSAMLKAGRADVLSGFITKDVFVGMASKQNQARIVMQERGVNRLVLGQMDPGTWGATFDSGHGRSIVMGTAASGASLSMVGSETEEPFAWMQALKAQKGGQMGVTSDQSPKHRITMVAGVDSGILLGPLERPNAGWMAQEDESVAFWIGEGSKVLSQSRPGVSMSWIKGRGGIVSVRHAEGSPGVTVVDSAKNGAGVTVGSGKGEMVRMGIPAGGGPVLSVFGKEGEELFRAPPGR